MATLQVTANHDYRLDMIANITEIDFDGAFIATFNQSQFGGTGISNSLLVSGGLLGKDYPVVEVFLTPGGNGFSVAQWSVPVGGFVVIRMIGGATSETITGADDYNANHEFLGGDGADTLIGGQGADLFIYAATGDVEAGEKIDGRGDDYGYDDDGISVRATNDFRGAEIDDIGWIAILGAGTTATFFNAQLRVPFADFVDKNKMYVGAEEDGGTVQTMAVEADTDLPSDPDGFVSLKYVSFSNWGPEDRILINGTTGNDSLFGSFHADTIEGGAGKDGLSGKFGKDSLLGGAGKDRLNGGADEDILTGGADKDGFLFAAPLKGGKNLDNVTDFEAGTDVIRLEREDFLGLKKGKLAKDAFISGDNVSKAKDAQDRIAYNETTGVLYFDRDGKGGAKAVQFAVLDGAPDLEAGDIIVFS